LDILRQLITKIKNKKLEYWINPAFKQLVKYGANVYADELKLHPLQFKSCYRMSSDTFQQLLNLIEHSITKRDIPIIQRSYKCRRKIVNNTQVMLNFNIYFYLNAIYHTIQ